MGNLTINFTVQFISRSQENTASSQVQVTWSLTHQQSDESLTLTVTFSNGTIPQQYQLEGNAAQQMVDTVPGMEYEVTVSVFNQDGTNTTAPVSFQTHPGCKHLHLWITVWLPSTVRLSNLYKLCSHVIFLAPFGIKLRRSERLLMPIVLDDLDN